MRLKLFRASMASAWLLAGCALTPRFGHSPRSAEDRTIISHLAAPRAFELSIFAKNVGEVRRILSLPDQRILIVKPETGDILSLTDRDQNGRADPLVDLLVHVTDLRDAAYANNTLYVASSSAVFRARLGAGAKAGPLRRVIDSSANLEIHAIGVGPDGNLYLSAGDEEGEKMYTAKADGRSLRPWAVGLQRTASFAWRNEDKNLWGADLSPAGAQEEIAPEELNLLRAGSNYGWPPCRPEQSSHPCPAVTGPAFVFPAQSGAVSMLFYQGSHFPSNYRGDALVALYRSRKVVRVIFEQSRPQKAEDFLTGFEKGPSGSVAGRPSCLGLAPDGAVLVADDLNGVIYRVGYQFPPGR